MAPAFIDRSVLTATKDLLASIFISQNAWLNSADGDPVIEVGRFCPGPPPVFCIFKMNFPAILFRAGGTNERAVDQQGFILDWPQKSGRQSFTGTPGLSIVFGTHHPACPTCHIGPDLIKQEQLLCWGIE